MGGPVFASGVREPLNTYAIVQTGSKQYRVEAGDSIRVESLPVYTGEIVDIDDVLMVSREGDVTVGAPVVEGARVRAQVTSRGRGRKITVFKYKPKVRYRRTKGHRQPYTDLRIIDISMDGESLAAVEEQAEPLDEVEETVDIVEGDVAEAVADEPANEAEDEATVAEDDPVDGDEPTDSAPDEPEGDAEDAEPVAEDDQADTDQPDDDKRDEPADEPESVAEPVDTDEVKKEKQDGA